MPTPEYITEYFNDRNCYHRTDGPAFIDKEEDIYEWWVNGNLHRTDGPAIISPHEYPPLRWIINGDYYFTNKTYQQAAGISDEEMLAVVLKYGDVE